MIKIYVRTQKRLSGNQLLVFSSLNFIGADNCETLWNKQRARNLFNSASFFLVETTWRAHTPIGKWLEKQRVGLRREEEQENL